MQIGEHVRAARKRAGLSQEALARQADMSVSAITTIELGTRADPHYSSLRKIADALDVSVAELVGEQVPAGKAERAVDEGTGRRDITLLDDLSIVEWLRERGIVWGTMTDAGFVERVRGLDPHEVDEEGMPAAVMQVGRDLTREQDAALDLLWSPKKYRSLGERLAVMAYLPAAEQKQRRYDQLRRLRKELRGRYLRRAVALRSYAELLAAQRRGIDETPSLEPVTAATAPEELWDLAWNEAA
jgi:transcriptional regulator with XRE-family HTH domain